MEKTIKFYTLSDPISKEIRYIGKTINSLSKRLSVHCTKARYTKRKCHRESWIYSLLERQLIPKIELIEECESTNSNWQTIEQKLIKKYREEGYNLVNIADGGEGCHGRKMSEAEKSAKSIAMKGRTFTSEAKKLMQLNHYNCKIIEKIDLNGRIIATYFSIKEAARQNNMSENNMANYVQNKYKKNIYKEFIFKQKLN